ncbi:hypothetical protein C1645_783323 [Glomus cerebriforme]|uniref:Reelin domain-containing protein n=1 Tax=Glomus cerebriforme TaxID=658196 RepID=A0A397SLF2_9GLOM|nr:hypothetical protein C1645_783323 [Glomus cerebriforme]
MGKMYEKLLSFILLLFISIPFYVSAFPNGAGTCNVEDMSSGDHGNSNLKGSAGYALTTTGTSGNFEFTLTGGQSKGIEGLLVYVVDANNKRLGQFTNLPSSLQFKDDCNVPSATITHKNKDIKNFPINLNWNAPQGSSGNLTVKALVVRDFKDWAKLDDVQFDPISGTTSSPVGSVPVNSGGQDTSSADSDSDNFLKKYLLFIIMIGITTLLYIVGSVTEAMLKRQQVKSRSFAKTIQNGYDGSG